MYNTQDACRWSVFSILIYEHGTVRHPILNCQVCSKHHSHVVWTKRWRLRLVGGEPIACKLQRPNLLCASLGAAELCSSFVKVLWSRNATRSHPRFHACCVITRSGKPTYDCPVPLVTKSSAAKNGSRALKLSMLGIPATRALHVGLHHKLLAAAMRNGPRGNDKRGTCVQENNDFRLADPSHAPCYGRN